MKLVIITNNSKVFCVIGYTGAEVKELFALSCFVVLPWQYSSDSLTNIAGGVSCSCGCLPIKECKVIYIDLITAKLAREKQQNKKVEKIISLVREYVCDDNAEYVCCPKYMGQFINNITNMVNTVYAINMDTIMVRSNMEESRWSSTETFFWRDESCFLWLGRFNYFIFGLTFSYSCLRRRS